MDLLSQLSIQVGLSLGLAHVLRPEAPLGCRIVCHIDRVHPANECRALTLVPAAEAPDLLDVNQGYLGLASVIVSSWGMI